MADVIEQDPPKRHLKEPEHDLQQLNKQLLIAQEEERAAIARELHDGVCQRLVAVQVMLAALIQEMMSDPPDPRATRLAELTSILRRTTTELQRITAGLRPAILDDLGLAPTLAWLCREFRTIKPDLDVLLDVQVEGNEIARDIATSVYRIVQEGLSNVFKHAGATQAEVRLVRSGTMLVLEVFDNGSGFDPDAAIRDARDPKRYFGLRSMRQRAVLSGGSFSLRSSPRSGTVIRVEWPATSECA